MNMVLLDQSLWSVNTGMYIVAKSGGQPGCLIASCHNYALSYDYNIMTSSLKYVQTI